jgi:hypothetical protein
MDEDDKLISADGDSDGSGDDKALDPDLLEEMDDDAALEDDLEEENDPLLAEEDDDEDDEGYGFEEDEQ